MSRVRRLALRGIRNFGPDNDETEMANIRFTHPLTLILGPNGTGKTTIIEALKYATTGEFPPGSDKGKSFIHDPMLTATASVRGIVKAEIVDSRGNILTVSRRINLTQQKGDQKKFSTMDSSLCREDKETGEKVMISQRCADVDVEVKLAMGVSKSILTNVIFCHQEDSNWPFEEGKKLKERFDQIFDSEKYNKALERIRKLIKDLQGEIRGLEAEKRSLQGDLEEALGKQKKLDSFEKRLEVSQNKVSEIMTKLEPLNQQLQETQDILQHYMRLNTEKEKKKTEYGLLKKQIDSLKQSIQEVYGGTTEELRKELASHDSTLIQKKNDMENLDKKLRQIIKEEIKLTTIICDQERSLGTLKQQVRDQDERTQSRNKTLDEMLLNWGLSKLESDVTESEATAAMNQLKEKMREMECSIEEMRIEHETAENKLQEELDEFRVKKSKLESEMVMRKREIAERKQEAGRVRAQVEEVNTSANKLNIIESKLQQANANVDLLTRSLDVDAVKDEIANEIKSRDTMESSLERVNKEVMTLQQQSSLQAELELHKTALTAKEKELQRLKNKHEGNLKMLLNVEVLPKTDLRNSLNHVQQSLVDQIRNLNQEIQNEQRQVTTLEITKKHQEQELKDKNAELETNRDKIASICNYKDYNEVLLLVSKTVKDLQDKRGMYAYQGVAYKEYLKKLEDKDPCCPLCHQGFPTQDDLRDLKNELNDEVNKYPNQLKTCEEQLKEQQKRYDTLLQLKPVVEKVTQFEEVTLKKLKDNLQETKLKLSESHDKMEQLQLAAAEPESRLAMCKDVVGDTVLWDQCTNEIMKLSNTITDVRSRMPDIGSDRTIQESQQEQESLRQSITNMRKRIESLQTKVNVHNEKLQHAREAKNKLFEEQLRIQSGLQKLKQLQDKLKELNAQEISLQEAVQDLQQQLLPTSNQLQDKIKLLDQTKSEHRSKQEDNRKAAAEKSKKLYGLAKVQSEIDMFIRHGITDTLKTAELNMEKYQKSQENLKSDKVEVESEIQNIRSQVAKQETRKRELQDNMTMRQKDSEAESLKQTIQDLREKLGGMNYGQIELEMKRIRREEEDLIREKNIAKGGQGELQNNIALLQQELSKDRYRLAHSNFINKCTELVVQEEAVQSLKAYGTALDRAMIEYHEERMATVNKIIKNLWELIYKGKDTTAIQINAKTTGGVGSNRRKFDYSLVQEKQNVQMEMRGRCSAGQKVLASIIIRMALAETFCKDCGVLALDEPTTNLDETNMKSLAEALATIVNIRSRHQENFQLIVITHDEKFLERLFKVEKIKKFYELYRYNNGLTGIKSWRVEGHSSMPIKDKEASDGEEDDAEVGKTGAQAYKQRWEKFSKKTKEEKPDVLSRKKRNARGAPGESDEEKRPRKKQARNFADDLE